MTSIANECWISVMVDEEQLNCFKLYIVLTFLTSKSLLPDERFYIFCGKTDVVA